MDVDGEDGAWSVPLRTMDLWVSNVASTFFDTMDIFYGELDGVSG